MDQGLIAINNRIYKPNEATLSPLDRGFLFGDSIFEVMVAFQGRILSSGEHLQRLRFSAQRIGFELPWSDHELKEEMESLCRHTGFDRTYIRLVVSRGEGWKLKAPSSPQYNKVLYVFPAITEQPKLYTEGISLKTTPSQRLNRGPLIKCSQYLEPIVAIKNASEAGFDDALWINLHGEVTEVTTANIFFATQDGSSLVTPPVSCGILEGITRSLLLKALKDSSLHVVERTVFPEDIPNFSEAFISSSIRGLMPVSRIDQHTFSKNKKAYTQAQALFMEQVFRELGIRVDWLTGKQAR